jgi:diphthamide biosynthesis protein 2
VDDNDNKPSACCRHFSDSQNHANPVDEKIISSSSSTYVSISNQPQPQEASVLLPSSLTSTTTFYVGGLELPMEMEDDAWSNDPYNVLFIGDDSTRQYGNVVLRFLSKSQQQRPQYFYTYDPQQERILTSSVTSFQRILNRRFYLIERAKQCTVFGILVATHFTDHMRQLVTSLRTLILEDDSRSCYTFAVGKINPAQLANFPEIQCFVLATGCPEHSILDNERELYHVPIVTPMELLMALNPEITWGSLPYSTHRQDYWKAYQSVQTSRRDNSTSNEPCKPDGDETDAPYFSLVSGAYE